MAGWAFLLAGCHPPSDRPFGGAPARKALVCRVRPWYSCLAVRDSLGREYPVDRFRFWTGSRCDSCLLPAAGGALIQRTVSTSLTSEPVRPASIPGQASCEVIDLAVDVFRPRPEYFLLDRAAQQVHALDHLFQYMYSVPVAISYAEKVSVNGLIIAVLGRYDLHFTRRGERAQTATIKLPFGCRGVDLAWDSWSRLWVLTSKGVLWYNQEGALVSGGQQLPPAVAFLVDPRSIQASAGGEVWIWDAGRQNIVHLDAADLGAGTIPVPAGMEPAGFFPLRNGFGLWDAYPRVQAFDRQGEPLMAAVNLPPVSRLEAVDATHFLGWQPGSSVLYQFILEQRTEELGLPWPK